ncbi:MAG: 4-alpha-glucanotransferase [bacterium]|nr:4-alpha-glucanotransferase [bacterium]
MHFPRASGILLHPTSLPGRYGIGDLGEWAYRFVDYLVDAGQTYWQMLPLGPTSYGDSPYQALSAFAGNPNLISLDKLVSEGWLTADEIAIVPDFPAFAVDYGPVIEYHKAMLGKAAARFQQTATKIQNDAFEAWCAENKNWLDDWTLYFAIKEKHGGKPWVDWDKDEALRDPETLIKAAEAHAAEIVEQKFIQWVFFRQWLDLKAYANNKGIRLIGDIPIFVAHDSSDVWANRELFSLDEAGNPTVIAGVPPDYFSETGQRWGNPLYRWDVLEQDGYSWWIRRVKTSLELVDLVRIDHFRGFAAYWEVPASEPTAVRGQWVPGPGLKFLRSVQAALSDLPIIAEDLGVITPDVVELRDTYNLPGMIVLQFAWGSLDEASGFLPHAHRPNSIVYTGTHDNNTTVGWWWGETDDPIRQHLRNYIGHDVQEPHWEMIRLAMMSVAHTAIIQMQDIAGLGADCRMNTPGKMGGNWAWRILPEQFDPGLRERLRWLTRLYVRLPGADNAH